MEKGRTEALAKERIGKVGLADKVVFMADEEGKPEEIFFNPKTPEARQFLRSVL
jgi:ABC-type histidine transport system ATPase subunit